MPAITVSGRVAKLLLGQQLRDLRARAGVRCADAASGAGIAWATVCRMERGDGRCRYRPGDVAALGRLYRADKRTTAVLDDLTRAVRVRDASERADDRCDELELLRDLEAYACRVRCYSPALVPELLRTREYARAVLHGVSTLVAAERWRMVELLRQRQDTMLARTG